MLCIGERRGNLLKYESIGRNDLRRNKKQQSEERERKTLGVAIYAREKV
jgi:hypothetical protein